MSQAETLKSEHLLHNIFTKLIITPIRLILTLLAYSIIFINIIIFILLFGIVLPLVPVAKNKQPSLTRKALGLNIALLRVIFRFFGLIKIELKGKENFLLNQPCIIAANHPSLIDAFLIFSFLPNTCCVIKSDLVKNPLYYFIVKACGYIVNHDNQNILELCVDCLKRGNTLLVFPEGTRSPFGSLHKFKRGVATVAIRSGCPIAPLIIKVNSNFWSKGGSYFQPILGTVEFNLQACYPVLIERDWQDNNNERQQSFALIANLEQFFLQQLSK